MGRPKKIVKVENTPCCSPPAEPIEPVAKSIEETELEILENLRKEMLARNLKTLEDIAKFIEIYKKQINAKLGN